MTLAGGEALREGAGQLVEVLGPVVAAAVLLTLLVGWLMHKVGVVDPTPGLVVRAAVVAAAVAWAGERWLAEGAAWTRGWWSTLPALGRGSG